jgi:hypothetical protein
MTHHGFPAAAVSMVENLDLDGMSSEASEGEMGMARIFRIKKLPWRNPDLTTWLHRIDRLPLKNLHNSVLTKRSVQRERHFSDIVSTKRPPVVGLPRNLYNPHWLQRQDSRAQKRLAALDDDFDLPSIDRLTHP